MTIIFCRHGETEFNKNDQFQGVSDSPLTEKGKSQAERINKFLHTNYPEIETFYISPLKRVKSTHKIVSEGFNAPYEEVEDLKEVCYGNWETKKREDLNPSILEKRSLDRWNFVHPGEYDGVKGQSYANKLEELVPFFELLKEEDGTVVVVSHHGVMLAALKYFARKNDQEMQDMRISNSTLLIVNNNKVETIEIK